MSDLAENLRAHFAALDTYRDETDDWQPFPPEWVLEGDLITDPDWQPNRWRRLADDGSDRLGIDLQLNLSGGRCRVRMPYRFDVLPDNGKVRTAPNMSGGFQRRWFEQVGDETHMLVEVV